MKNAFVYTAIVCASIGLNACHDDTKELLKTIDGQWEVKSILFTNKASRDSTVTPTQTYLNFESCSKSSNNGGPTNCAMQYRVNSKNYDFTYQASGADNRQSIYISPTRSQDTTYQSTANLVSGSFDILTLSASSLVLRRKFNCTTNGPETCDYVQITATK